MSVVMDGKLVLDLASRDGNAFVLMSHANRFATRMGLEDEEKSKIIDEMQSSDYDNLVEVFTKYFGAHVKLLGR
tara:strand:+ start:364 stop:585 length:222 start_codon:yes stop_codon:yes gene_type:complete